MKCQLCVLFIASAFFSFENAQATSYNSLGQTGLINIPSAEVHDEQSIYLVLNRNNYKKLGSITATPFNWMEASYFYYRPDDLLWGGAKGLYLDKGFNVKFSYKPKSFLLPTIAIGLDDFAGTGQFTREYIVSTYNFNKIKFTSGIGWGKYVGENQLKNPLSLFKKSFERRPGVSDNYNLGGSLSTDVWFRGPVAIFGGIEVKVPKINNLVLKIESDPFNYFQFGCCGEGVSQESFDKRIKDSNVNFGLSYKYKNFGNIDLSYIKGNSWNLVIALGFSSKKPLRRKNKFKPNIINNEFNQNRKNEFYYDLLDNLNKNKLYLQTASLKKDSLTITIDSEEHINPIIYSSRAAYIANKVSEFNKIDLDKIDVGQVTRGIQINKIVFKAKDLKIDERYPDVLIERNSKIVNSDPIKYNNHEFKPKIIFPLISHTISPDIRAHIGSPQRFAYIGIGAKILTEIQINRNIVLYSNIGKSFHDNFDKKRSVPNTKLSPVRTEIVDYLQQSSDDFYISNLELQSIWSPYKNTVAKISLGYLESMYGGLATELLYKPFNSNLSLSYEYNKVVKRSYDQKFSFKDYKISTRHLNMAFYEPRTSILAKWSYGTYLAGDEGYTLDLSRRANSGWKAGFFFSNTNVSAEQFGEGSFDKGFYFHIPMSIFSKKYTKKVTGFRMRTMTRDGGQQLELSNRLIDSFYGSSYPEIKENWANFLD